MAKTLENTYRLENANERLSSGDIQRALNDFEYFMANYQQIVNKERQLVPFKLNEFQRRLFSVILPMVQKETRLDRRKSVCVVKGRQVGASVGVVALINYICAFASGVEHTIIGHVFPSGDTVNKFYNQKVAPILSGVHPNLFSTMERETLSSSIVTHYKDIKGIPRDNHYEIISSGASSIRSSTINILLEDECFSGDVEVLTDKGFRRLDSLDKTEKIAQFDCSTSEISYAKPLRYIDREYNGDAFEWSYGDSKFVTTAMHDFIVGATVNQKKGRPNFYKKPACTVTCNANYSVPVCGIGAGDDTPLTALERIGIATQADGNIVGERHRRGKRGTNVGWTMCRLTVKRKSKIDRMRRLLDEASIEWKEEHTKRSEEGYVTFVYDLPYKNPKLLASFLSVECGKERAREILHEILHWDGYGLDREVSSGRTYLPIRGYYSSIVEENRDFVASIALQAGQRVATGTQVDNRADNHSDMHRLYTRKGGKQSYEPFSKKAINYSGRVYCVTVPTGAMFVRTGGKVWVCGNCSFYNRPEQLQDAVLPAIPDYGFSLIVYLSTVSDKKSTFFLDKIKAARDNPEDWELVFVPWFFTYPERPIGVDFSTLSLSEYEREVMVPAFEKEGLQKERWGDCIDWYRRRAIEGTNMRMEYPCTLEEVLTIGADDHVFSETSLQAQEKNIEEPKRYRLVTDNLTGKVEAQETDDPSPLVIYRKPVYGRRYRVAIDPITAQSDTTDYFVMQVFDIKSHEQMAVFHGKGYDDDTYADYAVAIAKIYNNAEICPEINVASGFIAGVNNRHYYHWFYANEKARGNKEIGLRTTATSKERMVDQLKTLLDRELIKIHDRETLDELNNFIKKTRVRSDGSKSIYMAAKGKTHDDLVMSTVVYAGSLNQRDLEQHKKTSFSIAW